MHYRIFLFLLLAPALCRAAPTPLFSSDAPLKAVLTAPISQAYQQKGQEQRLYLEGHWSYLDGDATVRYPVKIRTRGNYRRRVCRLPPLQLNFRKSDLEGSLLDGQDKLKMVSPCMKGDRYQQLIYLEYLIYQLYALYTDHHFRVRRVELGYNDSTQGEGQWRSDNFLIQDEGEMAASSGMKVLNIESPRRQDMNLGETAMLEVFQFVIGNVDYSTLRSNEGDCCHNVRLVAPDGADTGIIPVPYDFDSSGLINAPYATLPANVPIKKITQRYFNGWCKEPRRFREAAARLVARRQEAIALVRDFPKLESYYRKRAERYLEQSFEHLADPDYIDRYIIGRCRGEVIPG